MYNEALSAEPCIRNIAEYLSTLSIKTAIVAVNDGSTDQTLDILYSLQKFVPNLIVENHTKNGGYGAACRTGFKTAIGKNFDYALVMDADGTQKPAFIGNFFKPMLDSYDFIKATRYSKNGRVEGVCWKRQLISWLGNKFAKIVFRLPISDYTNGFRMIRTTLLKQLHTQERGFAVLLEEVNKARKLGATFYEVPYTLTVRQADESTSKFVYSLGVYRSYLRGMFNS